MHQGMIDWTSFLTDDPWFLPDPPPAGMELADALPTNVETGSSLEDLLKCPWHPNPSEDCCWRRAANDPFMGVEESVAGLGHFGVGFPNGHYPETVPGSFTRTRLELGLPLSTIDASFLDRAWNHGNDDGCFPDTTEAKVSQEDQGQSERSLVRADPVELSQETFEMINVTMEDSEEHAVYSEAILDPGTARPEPAAAAACPTSTSTDQCTIYQDVIEQKTGKRPADKNYKDESDDRAGPPAKVARRPGKYQRKRKFQDLDNSSEIIQTGQDDSDSDYAPDPRKKKRARITTPKVYKTPPATAKKPRRLKGKQVWYATNTSPAAEYRINARMPARDREIGVAAVANYVPNANNARFAATAKRARYAFEATTVRPQPGVRYEDAEDAQYMYSKLQEEFQSVKEQATGSGRNVQQVVFADRAGDATFAEYATSAEMIIKTG